MKSREFACIYYENEHNCAIGREGTFFSYCQHCTGYKAKPGAKPARTDTRRERLERQFRKERDDV